MKALYKQGLLAATLLVSAAAQGQVTHSIYEIQGELFASPLVGQTVTTSGIIVANNVTSTTSGVIGYFIQDAQGGPWSGVYVYDNTQLPNIGDEVIMEAEVAEYFDNTELINVTSFTVVSTGNTLPAPAALTTGEVAAGEAYEGCLVTITNAQCTTPDADFGEAIFDDGSGPCKTNDYIYIPEAGWVQDEYYTLTGPLNYHYEEYKIEVRSADDVQTGLGIAQAAPLGLQVYPTPARENVTVTLPEPLTSLEVYSVHGAHVMSLQNVRGTLVLPCSDWAAGNYVLVGASDAHAYRQRLVVQ